MNEEKPPKKDRPKPLVGEYPDPLEIPGSVTKACETITTYFRSMGIQGWKYHGIADAKLVPLDYP